MYSIYHFFESLIKNKRHFLTKKKLEDLPFDKALLSCRKEGTISHDDDEEADLLKKMKIVFTDRFSSFRIFKIKHHFNGYFLVFQTGLEGCGAKKN